MLTVQDVHNATIWLPDHLTTSTPTLTIDLENQALEVVDPDPQNLTIDGATTFAIVLEPNTTSI